MTKKPKVLLLDIETSPIISYTWGLFDQNVALNQIVKDWHVLSFAAKWLGEKKVFYQDQRSVKNIENDKELLKEVWKLMDEADVLLTQNGVKFDIKKLNARFVINGLQPPSSFKNIDTLKIAKKYFGFTSNKLEYMTDKLCIEHKKSKHKKFSGFDLWAECLKGNKEAWDEMKDYNIQDILSLEELYNKLSPWDNSAINFNLYNEDLVNACKCGSEDFKRNGYYYTAVGKFQRYKCTKCGSEIRDRKNLLSKDKKEMLKVYTVK